MSRKSLIWGGMIVGSFIGGFVPSLWDAGMLSMSSVIFTAAGGLLGIWAGLKIANVGY
ncbi:MAG: hypothetical protein WAV21_02060 [Minisyncoccia bacterium]